MKIVYILKSMAPIGGLERVMCDKMNYLVEHGYDVSLITYEQGRHPLVFNIDGRVRCIDIDVRFFRLYNLSIIKRVFYTFCYRIMFRKRLQCVISELSPDVIITTTYSMPVVDIIASLSTKAKKILESHVAFFIMRKTHAYRKNFILGFLAKMYDNHMGRSVSKFECLVSLTRGDANDWLSLTSKVVVIPNPVTLYPEADSIHSGDLHRIICVGRLSEQKGFDMLIDAFSLIKNQCEDWHIDIFGSGEEEIKLKRRIIEKGLHNQIIIHAPISTVYDEYKKSDFLVLSSRYEGFGLVLTEASACGLPIVSFRCKYGPEDIIKHGFNGLLVENGNIYDMAEKILWMIKHKKERLEMGINAREIAANYRKEVVMQQWESLLDAIQS